MMTDVDAVGTEIRIGTAAPNWGGNGGGIQVEFLEMVDFFNGRLITVIP